MIKAIHKRIRAWAMRKYGLIETGVFGDTLIVAPNAYSALEVVKEIGPACPKTMRVANAKSIHSLMSRPVQNIVVMPGVDLDANVGGEGSLEAILRKRQQVFKKSSFVRL